MAKIKQTAHFEFSKNMEVLKYLYTIGGRLKGMTTSEMFGSFLKSKHTTTLGSSPSTLKNLLKRNEGICPYKDLYT